MKKPLYNLFLGKIFRSSQINRSGVVTDSKAEYNSIRTGERERKKEISGFLWLSVSLDPMDLEKTLARDFGDAQIC